MLKHLEEGERDRVGALPERFGHRHLAEGEAVMPAGRLLHVKIDALSICLSRKFFCARDKRSGLAQVRGLIGIVTQESILFNDTVFYNIAFGVNNPDREKVIKAAKLANAHEFIMQMENGYDTNIGDQGGKLSGGQRQRLCIARAIMKNPEILILDEATSALDTESERLVQDALANLMKDRTSLVIAHRLSTIKNSDNILVMNEGRIVESGKHEELIEMNGAYKRLHDLQLI